MAERDNSLENRVVRLEERQKYIRDDVGTLKDRDARHDERIAEMAQKLQKMEWEAKRAQVESPLAHQVAAVDPALVRIVVGSLLAAVIGLATGNLVLFGE